jgi:hypothetical protein
MPDIVIGFLVGCALGFWLGYAIREQKSRKRRRHREWNQATPLDPTGETLTQPVPERRGAALTIKNEDRGDQRDERQQIVAQ